MYQLDLNLNRHSMNEMARRGVGIQLTLALDSLCISGVGILFREYAVSLNVAQCLQDFEAELAGLPGEYGPPRGSLLLATVAGELAGCCALRPLDHVDYANAGEMKRLYVRPQFRGIGLGRMLAEGMLNQARMCGFTSVLLDTLNGMEAARAMYDDLGFEEIPPYYYNPIAGAHYLKATL
jgi:ribosomal protein S18 acetylase RimI-like enzyme